MIRGLIFTTIVKYFIILLMRTNIMLTTTLKPTHHAEIYLHSDMLASDYLAEPTNAIVLHALLHRMNRPGATVRIINAMCGHWVCDHGTTIAYGRSRDCALAYILYRGL